MAYRRLSLEDVATLISHWQGRESERKIARLTGIDRKTVRRYLAAAELAALTRDNPTTDADHANLARRVQSRSRDVSSATRAELAGHEAAIDGWLAQTPPLRLREVHRRLVAEGVRVTYWTLRRFVILTRGGPSAAPEVRARHVVPPAPDSGVQSSDRGLTAESYPQLLARGITA
jgi:hypothetical protein